MLIHKIAASILFHQLGAVGNQVVTNRIHRYTYK